MKSSESLEKYRWKNIRTNLEMINMNYLEIALCALIALLFIKVDV